MLCRCDEVVDRVVTTPPSAATVRLLDDISDTVRWLVYPPLAFFNENKPIFSQFFKSLSDSITLQ